MVRNAIHKVDVLMPIRRAEDRVALRVRHSHCSPHGWPQVETDRVVVVNQLLALITLPGRFDSQPKGFGAFPSAMAAWADPPYLSTLHPSHPPANAAGRRLPPTRVVW